MNMIPGSKLCGFTVWRVREVKELECTFVEMMHDKTGAQLCWMDNKAKNKLFCVAFKTLPEDSTGVFHILEHAVLCGSEKYPVKEPFVDLMKGSMNTFLNAMTYPDKTVYPVSSCNNQDFLNLASVYLDAVFAPMLLKNLNIFYQEGIHTEIEEEEPYYKGVVFNEMKGAMAGVDDRIEEGMNQLLFPDNCYRFNSGGSPLAIPDLTYEQFVQTYQKFYHPSNARFFLDGDIPLEETLGMIGEYLDRYEKRDMPLEIALQEPAAAQGTQYYEISEEEDGKNKAILTLGKIIGTWEEREKLLAAGILCDVLADSNESPLKRAVLSSGMAEDFEMAIMDGMKQPYLLLSARNIDEANGDEIKQIIRDTAQSLLEEGLDRNAIKASINRLAFRVKQVSEPQGLHRALNSYQSWLYGGDPLMYLLYDEAIAALRKMEEEGQFEKLLEELLLDDSQMVALQMLPSLALGAQEREQEDARVRKEVSQLSQEELKELMRRNKALYEWQIAPDSPEAAAKIPALSLGEVGREPQCTKTLESSRDGATILYHPVSSHGIVYLSMYFPLTNFSLAELTELSLFPEFLGELPTEHYQAAQLQQKIKTYIGSLGFGVGVFRKKNQKERCKPCLIVRAGILEENLAQAKELILEILTNTQFDHPDKIKEILMQCEEEARQSAVGNGHSLGITAVQSSYSAANAVREAMGGYSVLQFLHDFAKNFDTRIDGFLALIRRVIRESIQKSGMVLSVTGSEQVQVEDLLEKLPSGAALPKDAAYQSNLPAKMGIRIPAQVSYAVQGYNLSLCGKEPEGSLWVAANIISLCYLWNEVRVQGGAYGTGFAARQDGGIFCYSYRDPAPGRSLQVYCQAAEFLKEFCESGEQLDKYIISAVAATDSLRTPREEGMIADEFWFAGITEQQRRETRRQMLETNRESIISWCQVLEKMAGEAAICVVGNAEALQECQGLTICEL